MKLCKTTEILSAADFMHLFHHLAQDLIHHVDVVIHLLQVQVGHDGGQELPHVHSEGAELQAGEREAPLDGHGILCSQSKAGFIIQTGHAPINQQKSDPGKAASRLFLNLAVFPSFSSVFSWKVSISLLSNRY